MERKVDTVDAKVDRLEGTLGGLARSLPTIVADAVREGLSEGGGKRKR